MIWNPKLHGNRGNLVNRIGLARRYRNYAICVAVVAICVAIAGWCRPVKVIAERPVGIDKSDCAEYARTMCNN